MMNNETTIKICLCTNIVNKANIRERKQRNSFTYDWVQENLTPKQIYEQVAINGHAFCVAWLKKEDDGFCHKTGDNWIGNQVLALDFDNVDPNGDKLQGDAYFSYDDALKDPFISRYASYLYTTPTHTSDHHRLRVVLFIPHFSNNKNKYEKVIKQLAKKFNGDPATTSSVQGFFGCKDSERRDFLGNLLPPDEFDFLAEQFDDEKKPEFKQLHSADHNQEKWTLDDYDELLGFIFKFGRVDNSIWWKIGPILKYKCGLDEKTIIDLISKYVEVGDTVEKIKYGNKYINELSIGTLIWLAQKNGYELPIHLRANSSNDKFWYTTPIIDDKTGDIKSYKFLIDHFDFQVFLEYNGFRLYDSGGGEEIVRVIDKIIYRSSESNIRSFIINHISDQSHFADSLEHRIVNSNYRKQSNALVTNTIKNLRHLILDEEISLVRDELNKTHLFFKNGVLVIEPSVEKFISYKDLEGLVFEERVLEREYHPSDDETSIIEKYIKRLSTTRHDDNSLEFNKNKFNAFLLIIGYLVNTHKRKDYAKAIILSDPDLSSYFNKQMGGTGKSLFCNLLSYVRNLTIIDGRKFKNDSEFNLDQVNEATDIVLINDCSDKFPFTSFYNSITDSLQYRKLYKSTVSIPFKDSPKFIMTTNNIVGENDRSTQRRRYDIEVGNFYNLDFTPATEFGVLYDSWDENEFNRFFKFVTHAVSFYYSIGGLVEVENKNLDLKQFQVNTSEYFSEWALKNLEPDTFYYMDSLHESYSKWSGEFISSHMMTKFLNEWAFYTNYTYQHEYVKSDSNRRIVLFATNKKNGLQQQKKTKKYKKFKLMYSSHYKGGA